MIGDEGAVAAEAVFLEMLVGKLPILPKYVDPLTGRECPEAEAKSGRRRGAAVVDNLIRVVQREASNHLQGCVGRSIAGEIQITAEIPQRSCRNVGIDGTRNVRTRVTP